MSLKKPLELGATWSFVKNCAYVLMASSLFPVAIHVSHDRHHDARLFRSTVEAIPLESAPSMWNDVGGGDTSRVVLASAEQTDSRQGDGNHDVETTPETWSTQNSENELVWVEKSPTAYVPADAMTATATPHSLAQGLASSVIRLPVESCTDDLVSHVITCARDANADGQFHFGPIPLIDAVSPESLVVDLVVTIDDVQTSIAPVPSVNATERQDGNLGLRSEQPRLAPALLHQVAHSTPVLAHSAPSAVVGEPEDSVPKPLDAIPPPELPLFSVAKNLPTFPAHAAQAETELTMGVPEMANTEGPELGLWPVSQESISPDSLADTVVGEGLMNLGAANHHPALFSHAKRLSVSTGPTWPCVACGQVACTCCDPIVWTVRENALFLHRSRADGFAEALVSDASTQNVIRSENVPLDIRGGSRFSVARRSNCGGLDFEGTYYLLDSWSGVASQFGDLTIRETNTIGVGRAFVAYETRLQNLEFNISKDITSWTKLVGGVRWITLDESASINANATLAPNYRDDATTTNSLLGGQMGVLHTFFDRGGHISIDGGLKGGIYGNDIRRTTSAYGGNPLEANATSFVGELDLNMTYDVTSHWSLNLGYQALWITQVAQAIDQFHSPNELFFDETAVLHGARFGAAFSW